MIDKGLLHPFKKILLHAPLIFWVSLASRIYDDLLWYPLVSRTHLRVLRQTA